MADLFFKSPEHQQRFLAIMREIGKIDDGKLDQEYASAVYILTSNGPLWQVVREFVTADGIDFKSMLEEVDFSHGYEILVKLAANLFNDRTHVDPVEFMILDEHNFKVALTSLGVRRYSFHEDDFKV